MATTLIRKTANGWVSDYPKQSKVPCPVCQKGTRIARVNKTTGAIFEGCSAFPACKWHGKTRYALDYGGGRVPLDLSEESIAEVLYGMPLADLYRQTYGKEPPATESVPEPTPRNGTPYPKNFGRTVDPVHDAIHPRDDGDGYGYGGYDGYDGYGGSEGH